MKQVSQDLLDEIVRRLVQVLQPQEIYLFGSHATGKAHEYSDLDLFVVVDDDAGDLHELATRGYSVLGLPVPVDLVVFHLRQKQKWAPVKYSLAYEATKKGKLLYAA